MSISLLITFLLILGTAESALINAILVTIKLTALGLFVMFTLPALRSENFHPFSPLGTSGIVSAAASIFFAYIGFDAVSTAAEETRNPQRNLPIAVIASLGICTFIYLLVAAASIGSYGAQPVFGVHGEALASGSFQLTERCGHLPTRHLPLVCSSEALAYVIRELGHPWSW